jgi:hypothetical protein
MVVLFNRAYITPHDGVTGLAGESVYVYSGSGVARAAAGTAPSATLVVSDSAASGNVEEGIHLLGYVFESASGYLSSPGGFAAITNAGGKKLNVDTIGVGPAGTVARVLIATRALAVDFLGDYIHQTWFIVPNGRIANNTDVNLLNTLSFFDLDLEDSADFLFDQLATIPAGVGIGEYNSHMIVWGENANPSIVRVSTSGEPESFDEAEGFITVNPGDASSGVKNCFEHNSLLIIQKSQRSYYSSDNDELADTWPVKGFDDACGTGPHGVAQVLDYGEKVENLVITAHQSGLRVFNGTFGQTPLTYPIDDLWGRINKKYFHTIQVHIDAFNNELYAVIPLDAATSPSHVLYGDFSEGLNAENIKWDLWELPRAPSTIVVDVDNTTEEAVIKWGSIAGNIYKFDSSQLTDFTNAIESYAEMALLPDGGDDTVLHFTGVRLRVKGSGTLLVTVRGLDDVLTTSGESITLSATPGKAIWSGFNFTSERAAVKVRVATASHWFQLNRFVLYAAPAWEQK